MLLAPIGNAWATGPSQLGLVGCRWDGGRWTVELTSSSPKPKAHSPQPNRAVQGEMREGVAYVNAPEKGRNSPQRVRGDTSQLRVASLAPALAQNSQMAIMTYYCGTYTQHWVACQHVPSTPYQLSKPERKKEKKREKVLLGPLHQTNHHVDHQQNSTITRTTYTRTRTHVWSGWPIVRTIIDRTDNLQRRRGQPTPSGPRQRIVDSLPRLFGTRATATRPSPCFIRTHARTPTNIYCTARSRQADVGSSPLLLLSVRRVSHVDSKCYHPSIMVHPISRAPASIAES